MLYSQLGYYFAAQSAQYQVKIEMKERLLGSIPDSSLEIVPLSGNEANIEWEETGKEFAFQGQMFDVVRIKAVSGRTVLVCINDKKEEELLKQMNNVTKTNNPGAGKNNKQVSFKLAYDFFVVNNLPLLMFPSEGGHYFADYDAALAVQATAMIAPPPRS